MTPLIARALVAAAAPAADCESVVGDLEEEHAMRARSAGRAAADRWYWAQALRSIPPLMSYARVRRSVHTDSVTALSVAGLLFAMLLGKVITDRLVDAAYPAGGSAWIYFSLNWADALVFGAVLAHIARTGHPVRLALAASATLVAGFTAPILLGFSRPLTPHAWLLLLGAVPALTAGAAAYRIIRTR